MTWWGSWIECASALNRLQREGGLDQHDLHQALTRLEQLAAAWLEIRPLEQVRRRALRLLRIHPLRGADALQLAAALSAAAEDTASLEFVSSDTRLSAVAHLEGFRVR